MTRKEAIDLMLSKVDADQKDAFIAELREAKTKEERLEAAKKYNATLSEEEYQAFCEANSSKLSDEELDDAAGGCDIDRPRVTCDCGCV